MRSIITLAAAALVAGMIVPHYAEQMNRPASQTAQARRSTPSQPASSSPYAVEVPRDTLGHFRVEGRVDGTPLQFMVDTGASVIALTADAAAQLGIHPADRDYAVLLKTANGTVRAAPATLDMVEIGNIMVQGVAAVIMPEGALSDNLLGMSFLSRLRHFDYSEGKMVLEQ